MHPRTEVIQSGKIRNLDVTESLTYQGTPFVPSAATDEKSKVSSNDTTAGYLNGKLVAGSNVTLTENNNGGDETLTISANFTNADDKVKVSAGDTTPAYLDTKLVAGSNVTLTKGNTGGNETYTVAATVPVTSVNTKTGAVTLTNTDVGAAATAHIHAASDITSGTIATARLGSGTASATTYLRGDQTWVTIPSSIPSIDLPCTEPLISGNVVNIYDNAGVSSCRKADCSNGRRAAGYVLSNFNTGQTATVYLQANLTGLSSLTIGVPYYLSTLGNVSITPPTTSGYISQEIGTSISSSAITFIPKQPITLA